MLFLRIVYQILFFNRHQLHDQTKTEIEVDLFTFVIMQKKNHSNNNNNNKINTQDNVKNKWNTRQCKQNCSISVQYITLSRQGVWRYARKKGMDKFIVSLFPIIYGIYTTNICDKKKWIQFLLIYVYICVSENILDRMRTWETS